MESRKKKKLKAAGWKVGTVSEFFKLTDEETALIELKLAKAARSIRSARKYSVS